MQKSFLVRTVLVLILLVLGLGIIYIAKPVLMPLTIAGVLAMLFMPFSIWMEKKGLRRGLASFICVFTFVLIISIVVTLLVLQISTIASDVTQIKQNVSESVTKLQHYLSSTFGISRSKQNKILNDQTNSNSGEISKTVTAAMGSFLNVVVDVVLVLVYTFLLLYLRTHFKNFILKIVPETQQAKARKIIAQSSRVTQKYLTGLAIIISMLWVMYGIGFSIVGIKSALFFAMLCGLLEVIPFVGNITGSSLTVLMALSQGGGIGMVIGVLVTYAIVQSIQFYIISPLVLGDEVNINPLFIILILLAGEMMWGVPGMILAIPSLGMIKIVFDNIEELKPYGYLIGQEKTKNAKGEMLTTKLKRWFQKYKKPV